MNACGILCVATRCKASPSQRRIIPLSASQSRTALAKMLAKTGWGSADELLMRFSTSVVARCCSGIVFSSWVRGSISFSRRKVRDVRRCWVIESRCFFLAVLRSPALADPPTDLERRRILYCLPLKELLCLMTAYQQCYTEV